MNPKKEDHQNNLWQPVPGNHGSQGPFDASAMHYSPLFVAKKYKWVTAAGIALTALGVGTLINKLTDKKNRRKA